MLRKRGAVSTGVGRNSERSLDSFRVRLYSVIFRVNRKSNSSVWGWRVPFLIGIALVAVGLFIRMKIAELPAFQKIKDAGQEVKMPLIEVVKKHPKNVLLAMGVRFAENGLFYLYAAFVFAYATNILNVPRPMILTGNHCRNDRGVYYYPVRAIR
jgi:MFS family permease